MFTSWISALSLAGMLSVSLFIFPTHSFKVPDVARRWILSWTMHTGTVVPTILWNPIVSFALNDLNDRSIVSLRIERGQRAGIELYDTLLDGMQVVTVKSVSSEAAIQNVVPGMVVADFQDAKSVVKRLREGPFPVNLNLVNPRNGGTNKETIVKSPSRNEASTTEGNGLVIRTVRQVEAGSKVRRDDIVEFVYEARMISSTGPVYDSSAQRGTGQPYQYVVGSGALIPGVDLGLYGMRPGEVRLIESK